jgi:hypothetical protein
MGETQGVHGSTGTPMKTELQTNARSPDSSSVASAYFTRWKVAV